MPWMECSVMDDRVRFVARLLDGEKMAQELEPASLLALKHCTFGQQTT